MRPTLVAASLLFLLPSLVLADVVFSPWNPVGSQGYHLFGFSIAPAGDVNHDGFGDVRHVRVLAHGLLPAGPSSRAWDGRDDRGARAAPGVYFVFLKAGPDESRTRVVLLP